MVVWLVNDSLFDFTAKVTKSGRAKYFVSFMREPFKQMKLPKYCLPKVNNTDGKMHYFKKKKNILFWITFAFFFFFKVQATSHLCHTHAHTHSKTKTACTRLLFWASFVWCFVLVILSSHLSACLLLQDMHIISTDEKQVFAAVQEWNQNNTYSLYISDSPGVYFILSLENLRTSRGPAGNLLVDFYKVCCQPCSRTLLRLHH